MANPLDLIRENLRNTEGRYGSGINEVTVMETNEGDLMVVVKRFDVDPCDEDENKEADQYAAEHGLKVVEYCVNGGYSMLYMGKVLTNV